MDMTTIDTLIEAHQELLNKIDARLEVLAIDYLASTQIGARVIMVKGVKWFRSDVYEELEHENRMLKHKLAELLASDAETVQKISK